MNKAMKRSAALLALSMTLTGGAAYAAPGDAVPAAAVVTAQPIAAPVQITLNNEPLAAAGYLKAGQPMLPLRAVSEALGFTLTWNQADASVDLVQGAASAHLKTGEDQYSLNKAIKTLGAAPELVDNTLYIPASFVSEILNAQVQTEGAAVTISNSEVKKTAQTKGIITAIRDTDGHRSIQLNGVAVDGIVLNVSDDTVYEDAQGAALAFADLAVGMEVEAEHSLAATLSLPPQTPTYKLTVISGAESKDMLGTSGTIEEVRTGSDGSTSLLIKGTGLTETSPGEIVLQLSEQTKLTDIQGEAVDASKLTQGAKVIAVYSPVMIRSLPPIGKAAKIVLQAAAE
ncbi:Protease inhibitor precursor [Paenibacillus konkukensis]|uniref:Protease inhibitor n=1 Tax=Paenibacillus konkukensis TaxID=2020716 RepID=A0ABY4RXD6_9BACL|nr:stalk domain-containing protein [Paenibacillus konkukensis]UQZ86092.1 Protease inhibitor precursor [Paenibacillus konkukensis]